MHGCWRSGCSTKPRATERRWRGTVFSVVSPRDQLVAQPFVVPFAMVMRHEVGERAVFDAFERLVHSAQQTDRIAAIVVLLVSGARRGAMKVGRMERRF
jgi:hypothetical protein